LHERPDVTVETTADVMMQIVRGEVSPPTLLQQGKIKLSGNPALMLPLQIVIQTARRMATASA
jgi:putative sterol carrier protein